MKLAVFKESYSASSWSKTSLRDSAFEIFDLVTNFGGLSFVMFSVFEQISEFLFLRENFDKVWIQFLGIVREHLEILLNLHHLHVLQELGGLLVSMTRLAADPSNVINDNFRGIFYENVGPEVLDEGVWEKVLSAPLAIFSKSWYEFFPFAFAEIRKDSFIWARKQDGDHFDYILVIEQGSRQA